ncbi:proteasome complex subunit Rpn13 ubiquitin receptor-domain-containing protein [Syncephalastrum racemosum]|uniref:Proteasome complex subunit Rpn13 ubiquitin receptor-domain-containing protein n=1 Tax=Syncephalastrum racemosum TaxID=13706 RepID=A0A1X2HGD2_SYNRA|nr:proteasome complex subunit Rpn13 ubiquitin receptor-domain-containing protein [Syncephalastrum racemosum]
MSLFPAAQQPRHLVEFNAGKCIYEDNMLRPDLRKGVIYMDQSDDQLMHFYWKERRATEPEEDLIIFPDEAELVRIPECTTGRVYLLKFKSSERKLFFWMQNKNDEKDEENVSKVNRLINDPETAVRDIMSGAGSSRVSGLDMDYGDGTPADVMQLLGGSSERVSRDNILQFLQQAGGFGGTVPNPIAAGGDGPIDQDTDMGDSQEQRRSSTSQQQEQGQQHQDASSTVNSEQLQQLRNALANVQVPEGHSANMSLSQVLTPQALTPLLNDPEICAALFPHLPENSERTPEEVRQVVQSPQFQQSLDTLSFALQSGELGPLLTQLGLPASAGQNVEAFLNAIEEQARRREHDRNNDDAMEED